MIDWLKNKIKLIEWIFFFSFIYFSHQYWWFVKNKKNDDKTIKLNMQWIFCWIYLSKIQAHYQFFNSPLKDSMNKKNFHHENATEANVEW